MVRACLVWCAGGAAPLELFALFGAGAFLMRGAGCTVNDMWDRRFDAAVSRTAARPLASGEVSLGGATVFLVAQLTGALWCLLQLNGAAGAAGAAVLPLVALYPALKRATHAPQAALGLAMNWGVVMAAAAVRGGAGGGSVEALRHALGGRGGAPADAALRALEALRGGGSGGGAPSVALWRFLGPPPPRRGGGRGGRRAALYLGCAAWTVVYDTLYAHQDRKEDAALGLRSTAVWLGDGRAANVAALGALTAAAGALWAAAGAAAGMGAPFFVGAGAATAHVGWQVATARFDDRANLGARFVSNKWAGGLLLAGAVAGRLM